LVGVSGHTTGWLIKLAELLWPRHFRKKPVIIWLAGSELSEPMVARVADLLE
jgi:hypothetical protein